jgi:hypothetical protein
MMWHLNITPAELNVFAKLVDTPLRIRFAKLYEVCADQKAMVVECAANDWQIQFQRVLTPEAKDEWVELQDLLQGVSAGG